MVTDMLASTALRARLGEERADALRRVHDSLLAERVEANGGRVHKGQADGVVAAFPAASDGLRAAVEIQQAPLWHRARGRQGSAQPTSGASLTLPP